MSDSATTAVNHQVNSNIQALKPSVTLAINEQCQRMVDSGEQVFRLGFGQSPYPVPAMLVQALKDHAHQKAYMPVQGLLPLRQQVCDFFQRTEGLNYKPEQLLVGPGSKELMFLLQAANEAELILPSPSWVSYEPQAKILGREVSWLPGDLISDPNLIADALERHCVDQPDKPRLLVLNYPINPTGSTYSNEQLQKIAEVARRYRIMILSDEIYSGLHFRGEHVSIARYYPEGTIVSNGLSKWCGAGGWRLGVFAFPAELETVRRAVTVLATETFSAVASPIQYAAIEAFKASAELDHYLQQTRAISEQLTSYGYRQLSAAGAELCRPQGGFYLFPRVDALREKLGAAGQGSAAMCQQLLADTGVAILPGAAFGRPAEELSTRIACVDFDGEQALAAAATGVSIDEDFIKHHCAHTVEAIDRLCHWLGSGASAL